MGGLRDPLVKYSVSLKISKFVKIGSVMLFLLEEKIGIGMLLTLKNRYR